ncbi:PadR family transcriptional regulator [Bacillus sp. KH172YL63]|uniref:PadR family transcriptional regulator n=1 Tax=Bacillus sp. KH172YL63 TaxID=2709784 RepID=UPI0015643126|nr:PadR family transcriptional regulator [Bacillus sp. KH172YL63]
MEDRFKNLKRAMDGGSFRDMPFTEEKKQMIKHTINTSRESDDDIQVHILQLLLKEKTGHELHVYLRARGIKKYEERQGFLYTVLHKLEQERILESIWSDGEKRYVISKRGRKLLQQIEEGNVRQRLSFKGLLEGE